MYRDLVISSNVLSIGYDSDEAILEVEFKNRSVYWYFDVPEEVFDDFMMASSKGKYMWDHIRDIYEYERQL